MSGFYVHTIDPVIVQIAGVCAWWYGLSYALGFLQLHCATARSRTSLGLSGHQVYTLTLLIALGVLAGGRAVEVAFDEWPFYRGHPQLIPALWLGGMATHGLLLGALAGAWVYTRLERKPFLELADALVVPGALLMGLGRIGNFIDGQIVGSVTDVWWAVKFPDADGFRHPVVLYDGVKNLLLVPYLVWVRRTNSTPGAAAARFVFWYAFPRIFIDLFRDYPRHRLELGTGQTLNLLMAGVGAVLLVRSHLRRRGRLRMRQVPPHTSATVDRAPAIWQRLALAAVLLLSLTIPSNWTQDVPGRYGERHRGLQHSWLYPQIDTGPRQSAAGAAMEGPERPVAEP